MYIGRGTVQVSATIEVHGESDITYELVGNQVQVTLGTDTDACLVLTERGTKRLADTLSRATAELRSLA
jgi:hypothetical protein